MRLVTACFDFSSLDYQRLGRAFVRSCERNMPDQEVEVIRNLPDHDYEGHASSNHTHKENTAKAIVWNGVVQSAKVGDELCLIDCDTVVLRDLRPAFDSSFDLAITVRNYRLPINTGVVFVRVSPKTKRFFDDWTTINQMMLADEKLHQSWRKGKYGGIHQAALGYMLEQSSHRLRIAELPCHEWNCEWTSWRRFNRDTRVLHILKLLRLVCLGESQYCATNYRKLVDVWKQFDDGVEACRA